LILFRAGVARARTRAGAEAFAIFESGSLEAVGQTSRAERPGEPTKGSEAMAGSPDAVEIAFSRVTASRRLAYGFRPFAKTMKAD